MNLAERPLGRRAVCVLFALLATSWPLAARAQGDASSRALAVQLFDEAEALLAKGQVAQACPKYAASYRLDPQLGALIYLAECYEKNGQLASAWGSFREADEIARKRSDARAEHARQRAIALEPRLSYLVIQVPKAARLSGLEVLRDNVPIVEVLWGSRAAIDSGTHRISVRAPGHKPWQKEVEIVGEASSVSVEIPQLEAEAAVGTGGGAQADGQVARVQGSPGTSRRIAAIAVGGLGLVGVGVGGFFGLSAQSSLSDSKDLCNESDFCTERGLELRNAARDKALVATIATGVGAAALVTAAVLWFTAPRAEMVGALKRPSQRRTWAIAPARDAWGVEMSHAF